MKVCIIRPPKLVVSGIIPPESYPPLGVALVAAAIREAGHSVTAIDGISERPAKVNAQHEVTLIGAKMPKGVRLMTVGLTFAEVLDMIPTDVDVVAVSAMFSINWPSDRELMNRIGERFPDARLIAGGESVTGMAETCMKQVPALSVCILGEGEQTVVELLRAVETGEDFSAVNGIMYRDGTDELLKTPPRPRIKAVDDTPMPAWDLLPVDNYQRHAVLPGEEPRKTLAIMATRGCPYQCTFCTSPDMWGTRYYMRSPMNVIREIEHVRDTFGVTNFEFFDLTAIIKKDWIIEFASLLISRKVGITWKIPAGTRSEAIDAEVADHLHRSGCYFICYAPESGSPALLKKIKKKVSLDSILQSMRESKSQGMLVFINMIMALPEETHSDVWKSMRFLVKCKLAGVDEVSVAVYRPYVGSAMFNRLLEQGLVTTDDDRDLVESLLIISGKSDHRIYNPNISPLAYKVYHFLLHLSFYGTGYLMRPVSFLRAIRNLVAGEHDNQWEKRLFARERLESLEVSSSG